MKKKLTLLFVLLANHYFVEAQWNLTGNTGTNPPTNFLGTTDAKNLIFKVSGQQAGLLDYNSSSGIAAFGYQTVLSNTGTVNTATGYQALFSNTTGSNNDAYGFRALYNNTTANANSAFGNNALYNNTTGYNNFAFGCYALYSNSTGNYNVASGGFSLFNNTSGAHNTALGYRALSGNTIANDNTAVGYLSLYSNTLGMENTSIGSQTLYTNSSGSISTAVGYQALYTMDGGEWNTACGAMALYSTTSESSNTAVGYMALFSNTTGYQNTADGRYALFSNTTGNDNTALGEKALYTNTTGAFNTALGMAADVNAGNYTNTTVVGYLATGTASNQVRFGNSSVTSIRGYVNWSNISDGRFKKNIKENVPGLEFINQLRPVSYNLDIKGINQFIRPASSRGAMALSPEETEAIDQKEKILNTGFVAQEVEGAAKKLGFDFSGIDAPKNEKDLYGLRYDDFVVPLVKSVQELSATHDSLKAIVDTLESQVNELWQEMQMRNAKKAGMLSSLDDIAVLNQNAPNPFNNNTIISFNIPSYMTSAELIIVDMNGQVIKNTAITGKGSGQIVITAGSLASGNYIYTLIVNGVKIATKQMILTK